MASEHDATTNPTEAADRRAASTVPLPLLPKEHGASFMIVHALLLGVVGGLVAGGHDLAGMALALAMGLAFLPLAACISVLSHQRTAASARRRLVWLAALEVALGTVVLLSTPIADLIPLAAATIVVGAIYSWARISAGPRSQPAELLAIAGLSLMAPLAWLLVAGPVRGWAFAGPAAFLAFGGTVPYVRERVRRRRLGSPPLDIRLRRGLMALAWQAFALASAVVLAARGAVNPLVPLAFVPAALKTAVGIAAPESRPPIKRIGYLETAISTVFAVAAGIALALVP